jgi:hypothetical protein
VTDHLHFDRDKLVVRLHPEFSSGVTWSAPTDRCVLTHFALYDAARPRRFIGRPLRLLGDRLYRLGTRESRLIESGRLSEPPKP